MKIFITGGSGFVGTTLTQKLTDSGHQVTILTRSLKPGQTLPAGASFLEGDPVKKGKWQDEAASHDAVVNLAGASIFARWTESYKKNLRESRLATTKNVVDAVLSRKDGKTALVSASAVGYYGSCRDEAVDENAPPGDDFLARLAFDWEQVAFRAKDDGARVVICRFGIVMGKNGGALKQMLTPFKFGMGAPLGSGKQWFSWIHEYDLVRAIVFAIENGRMDGPFNCAAPNPLRNRELTKAMAKKLGKMSFPLGVPAFVLKLMLGEFGTVLLDGQRVYPQRLLEMGFSFRFPTIEDALDDLMKTAPHK
jgi:uncharacterized protein (TIGR01777 family)